MAVIEIRSSKGLKVVQPFDTVDNLDATEEVPQIFPHEE